MTAKKKTDGFREIKTLGRSKAKYVEFADATKERTWRTHFSDGQPFPVNDEVSRITAAYWRPVKAA